VKKHEDIVSKFDFSKPILDTVYALTPEEFDLLTEVPKYFKHPENIRYKQGWW